MLSGISVCQPSSVLSITFTWSIWRMLDCRFAAAATTCRTLFFHWVAVRNRMISPDQNKEFLHSSLLAEHPRWNTLDYVNTVRLQCRDDAAHNSCGYFASEATFLKLAPARLILWLQERQNVASGLNQCEGIRYYFMLSGKTNIDGD